MDAKLTGAQTKLMMRIHAAGTDGLKPDRFWSGAQTKMEQLLREAGLIEEREVQADNMRWRYRFLTVDGLLALHRAGALR